MQTKTATNAKVHFGEILDTAKQEPIIIQKSGKKVAVLLSFKEYQRLSQLEDCYWANKAKSAKKEGFIGKQKSEKLLEELLNAKD